jgi:DNA-binding NarL/FixJ family response regulator
VNLLQESASWQPTLPLRIAQCSSFACVACHRIRAFTRIGSNSWNNVVTFFSGGLLYGHEVPRPQWLKTGRRVAYTPRPNRAPSWRRPQITDLLLQGLTYAQIGRRLGMKRTTIDFYVQQIYAQHAVHSRLELSTKLGRCLPPRPPTRLQIVTELLASGLTRQQIAQRLGILPVTVRLYAAEFRRKLRREAGTLASVKA